MAAHLRGLLRYALLVAAIAAVVPAAALAQDSGVDSSAPRVARSAGEVPADWIAAHPHGGCSVNPFSAECGAPGHPITIAYFPSATQLRRQLDGDPTNDGDSGVTIPGGPTLAVATPTTPTAARAVGRKARTASTVGQCTLTVYAPSRVSIGGNIEMESVTTVDACSGNVIEANGCTDLYQRTTWKASDCDPQFGIAPVSVAQAFYDCGHSNIIQYKNQGTGYMELYSGAAAFNSADSYSNHSCT
jgi:hypothetical protein